MAERLLQLTARHEGALRTAPNMESVVVQGMDVSLSLDGAADEVAPGWKLAPAGSWKPGPIGVYSPVID